MILWLCSYPNSQLLPANVWSCLLVAPVQSGACFSTGLVVVHRKPRAISTGGSMMKPLDRMEYPILEQRRITMSLLTSPGLLIDWINFIHILVGEIRYSVCFIHMKFVLSYLYVTVVASPKKSKKHLGCRFWIPKNTKQHLMFLRYAQSCWSYPLICCFTAPRSEESQPGRWRVQGTFQGATAWLLNGRFSPKK